MMPVMTTSPEMTSELNRWFEAWRPKVRKSLSVWARDNARLDDGSSYVAFPFQDGIADAMSDPAVTDVSVKKSSRVGYSQIVKNLMGYTIDQVPRRVITYFPTVRDAEKFARKEFTKVLTWPSTRRNVTYGTRDPRNVLRQKEFPGGSLLLNGTNSPGEFRADTADTVICEEPDGYPAESGVEGDPIELAWKRVETSDEPKRIAGSTPTIKGASKIDFLFQQGTQEYRYVPCPHCGLMQRFVFGDGTGPGLKWEPREAPTRAWYRCEAGCDIEEFHKGAMDAAGEWRASAPQNWPHRSFHIWAAYSQFPGAAWLSIVRHFLKVRKDRSRLKVFVNQVLGECFEVQGEAPPWRRLYDRREAFEPGRVPRDAVVLTGGMDVQKDRLELFIWGWGADRQCWLVDHVVLPGNPFQADVWSAATEAVQRTWRHAGGAEMRLLRVGADTGFATTQVERWARRHPALVIPVKGSRTMASPAFAWSSVREAATHGGRRKRGQRLGMVGGHVLTMELYGFLALDAPTEDEVKAGVLHPVGFVHLGRLASEELCKQMVGDQWVEAHGEWRQVHATEALDGWKYARAMCAVIGLDRWPAAKWRQVAQMLDFRTPEPEPELAPTAQLAEPVASRALASTPTVVQPKRTAFRASFQKRR